MIIERGRIENRILSPKNRSHKAQAVMPRYNQPRREHERKRERLDKSHFERHAKNELSRQTISKRLFEKNISFDV